MRLRENTCENTVFVVCNFLPGLIWQVRECTWNNKKMGETKNGGKGAIGITKTRQAWWCFDHQSVTYKLFKILITSIRTKFL